MQLRHIDRLGHYLIFEFISGLNLYVHENTKEVFIKKDGLLYKISLKEK